MKEEILKNIKEIEKGCGKRIDYNGDCAFYSDKGTLRLCSNCYRKRKKLQGEK